ncbi:unnamed protein product [Didymodactylos carnosus]|uniref:Vacuolar fusion protein MON1 homolog n=1 Tax=Didymodactylos carnosus TaxID=1234261 RepID=A0A8S2DIQ6_9BILA|nr:unnamed protein product [Didymodactylos carnosus]CAF3693558.1 unnamed protein product [Didymodactylos carnosus]
MKFMQRSGSSSKKQKAKLATNQQQQQTSSQITKSDYNASVDFIADHPGCWRLLENEAVDKDLVSNDQQSNEIKHPTIIYKSSVFSINNHSYTRLSFQNYNKKVESYMSKYNVYNNQQNGEDGELKQSDEEDNEQITDEKLATYATLMKTIRKKFNKKSSSNIITFDNSSGGKISKRKRRRHKKQQQVNATLLESLPSFSSHNSNNEEETESGVFLNLQYDQEQSIEEGKLTSTGLISEIILQSPVPDTVDDEGASNNTSYPSVNKLVYSTQPRMDDEQSIITTTTSSNEHNISKHQNDTRDIEESFTEDDYEHILKSDVKHIFILSDNGKPVFTRYGDEEKLLTLMGVMQSLISFAEIYNHNQLNYIKAGRSRVVFLHNKPLIFILVTRLNENYSCLLQQLNYCYYQIISTLTSSSHDLFHTCR